MYHRSTHKVVISIHRRVLPLAVMAFRVPGWSGDVKDSSMRLRGSSFCCRALCLDLARSESRPSNSVLEAIVGALYPHCTRINVRPKNHIAANSLNGSHSTILRDDERNHFFQA